MHMIFRTLIAATCLVMAVSVFVHGIRLRQARELSSQAEIAPTYQLNDLVIVWVNSQSHIRATNEITEVEQLDFKLAAVIVEIRPDGKLELKARKTIRVDDEVIETILTGTASPADISPDRTVSSTKLAEFCFQRRRSSPAREARARIFDKLQDYTLLAGKVCLLQLVR